MLRLKQHLDHLNKLWIKLLCPLLIFLLASNFGFAQRTTSIGSAETFVATAGIVRSARINDSHFVVFYKENGTSSANDLYARVGEVDSENQTITWGVAALVESETCLRSTITELNETQVVVAYERGVLGIDTGIARVLTIDTATDLITVGDAYAFHEAAIDPAFSHTPISMVKLTDAKFAICFADDATDDGQIVIGNASGSVLTFGAAQEWSSGNVHNFWVDTLTSTKIIISYEDDGSTNDLGRAIIGDISGNTVTYGSEYTYYDAGGANSISYNAVKSISATTAIIAYTRDSENKGYAVVATISGNSISYGTSYAMPSETSTAGPRDITVGFAHGPAEGDNEVAIAYNTGSLDTSFVVIAKADGNVLSFTSDEFLLSEGDDSWILSLNENTLVASFVNDNNGDTGQAIVVSLSPKLTDPYASEVSGSGYALDFDGINDIVDASTNAWFPDDQVDDYTYETWIRPNSVSGAQGLISYSYDNNNNEPHSLILLVNGALRARFRADDEVAYYADLTGGELVPDQWYHVALTKSGSDFKLFLNGMQVASTTAAINGAWTFNRNKLIFGANWNLGTAFADEFNGRMDEVRIWSAALDQSLIREWMAKKVTSAHDSISSLEHYYRFDDASGNLLNDLIGGNDGTLTNMDAGTDWVRSGAALGDESVYTYSGTTVFDTLSNGNVITLDDFAGSDGIHLYTVNDTAKGSVFPGNLNNIDSLEYFGAFMVGGASYDVTIDYTNNLGLSASGNEKAIRTLKRNGGDDNEWALATGRIRVNALSNTISIPNQTGTEYVTGFVNTSYPNRAGSGYALDFDGLDDAIVSDNGGLSGVTTGDSITVEVWINTSDTATAFPPIFASEDENSAALRILFNTDDKARISIREAADSAGISIKTDSSFIDGNWHHLAFTYNGNLAPGGMNIYVDGVDVPTSFVANQSTTIQNYSDSTFIGRSRNSNQFFEGNIDELRIWNSVLDQTTIRDWMCRKVNNSHPDVTDLISYHRFDDGTGTSLEDLAGGASGSFESAPIWEYSGAALGDESYYTYGGTTVSDTLSNGNIITLDDFSGADGMHLYFVNDSAAGSTFPTSISGQDDSQYFGAHMVNGTSYTATIDYSNNNLINGQANEVDVRGLKRTGGDDSDWSVATGIFGTDVTNNIIIIPNQTGTEYVTGFANDAYPSRPGAGYALDCSGVDDRIEFTKVSLNDGLTYTAWIKTSSADAVSSYSGNAANNVIGDHTNDVWNGFGVHAGKVRYNHYTGAWNNLDGTSNVNDGEWHHIAVSHSEVNDSVWLYVDGILENTAVYGYGDGGGALKVGFDRISGGYLDGAGTADFFGGSIDEVSIWSAPLPQELIREWMTKKITASHDSIGKLVAYYRFDEAEGDTLFDLVSGNDGILTLMDPPTDWVASGAAIGDVNFYTYGGTSVSDTLSNGNVITLDDFDGADGMHLYFVNDTAFGSSYPTSIDADSAQYFGAYMVNGSSYDVTIDYSSNNTINGQPNEALVRGVKRSGGDDPVWNLVTGELRTNTTANTISILDQTGTEYVTGFSNAAYPVRAGSGYTLDFDGTNDQIEIPHNAALNLSDGDFAIESWIYVESASSRTIVSKGHGGGPSGDIIIFQVNNNGKLGLELASSPLGSFEWQYSDTDVPLNEWVHVAVSFDHSAKQATFYQNGVQDGVKTYSLGTFNTIDANPMFIGRQGHGCNCNFFDGKIDELRIWDSRMPQDEIREWMTKKVTNVHDSIANLLAYYRFDDGSGSSLEDLVGGHNGTLNNMDPATDWLRSGAALGDENIFTYTGSSLVDTLSNNNEITIDDFAGADGIHLYLVNDTAEGSTLPLSLDSADSVRYFGVFMVGGTSYDVTIDYTNNTSMNGAVNELAIRGLKRSGGDDANWEFAAGELRTNIASNTISILNQTGTEYVTGFANATYPQRVGSGYVLDFDGVDDYVNLGDVEEVEDISQLTIEAWVKPETFGNFRGIVSKLSAASVAIDLTAGGAGVGTSQDIFFRIGNGSNSYVHTTNTPLELDEWMHVAAVFDGNQAVNSDRMALYINGVYQTGLTSNGTFPATTPNSAVDLQIGRYQTIYEWDGNIDEVRIWGTALDSNQIRDWMTQKLTNSHDSIASLISYYRFDETTGSMLGDLVSAIDGTLTNMDPSTDWVRSGAALGDESINTYSNSSLIDTLSNNNEITVDNYSGADGIHLYMVNDTAEGSTFPVALDSADSVQYFGVFMAGGSSYDVTIDYTNNASLNGVSNEDKLRGVKRSGGDDVDWEITTGELFTNVNSNTIQILSQTGTEYVTGFTNLSYPVRPGSGYSLDFDGVDDHILLSQAATNVSAASLGLPDTAITIEAWVNLDNFLDWRSIVHFFQDNGATEYGFTMATRATGQFSFALAGGGVGHTHLVTTNSFNTNQWYHVAATYDGATMNIYVNGILEATSNAESGDIAYIDSRFRIGKYEDNDENYYFDGNIDEVRLWNVALDQSTLREWMTKKLNNSHSEIAGLNRYYRFDDATGASLVDLAGVNDGDLTSMDPATDWVYSGAALGDESKFTYSGSSLVDTLTNGNEITLDDFDGADGIHLYVVNDTAEGSSFPTSIDSTDTIEYFGVFMVNGSSYDVTIDYSNNFAIANSAVEQRVRGLKRSGGDDSDWQFANGEFLTDTAANTITIQNQTGTEYVTGFNRANYPARPGSGFALDFDGVDDQIYIGDILPDDGSFTISTWFNSNIIPTGGGQEGLFVRGLDGSGSGWSIALFLQSDSTLNGAIVHAGATQVNTFNGTKIQPGDWHHVALTWDTASSELKLYIDGVFQATGVSGSPTLRSSTLGSFIGRGNIAGEAFNGKIDELAIWNDTLSQTEIRDWMVRKIDTSHASFGNMVAYYRFDEAVGDSLFDIVGANDGPLANMNPATDWELSGASLGDVSAYSYSGSSVILGSNDLDTLEVSAFSGAPTGIQVYRVDEAPNDTNVPIGSSFMDTTHYYGFFLSEGTNPRANVGLYYGANAGYTAVDNGDNTLFIGRDGNDDNAWSTKASALITNNTAVDSVVVFSQGSGTEIIVGRGDYLTPPGSGYALDFDGSGEYIDIPDNNAFDMSAVTIETWINWAGGGAIDYICGKAVEELEIHIGDGLNGADSSIRFIPTPGVYFDAPANAIKPNTWNHVACVYDPSNSRNEVYINGVRQATTKSGANPITTAITQSASNYYLGIRSNGTFAYEGKLDEFRIWNTALDSAVIRKWMSRKMDVTHDSIANCVAYYRFDQLGDTNLIDLIGGKHGDLTNMDETTDWVTSGAAIGDMSVYTYDSTALAIELPNNDSVFLTNFDAGVDGVQLYYVGERSNFTDFYGARSVDTTFYFGVHKAGDDTATYDVTMRYGNSSHLTGASAQYRVGLAKRDNNADISWESDWFDGTTNTGTETIFLPNQSGTEYAGIVNANNALDFDGTNDYVRINNQTDLQLSDGPFTIDFWAKGSNSETWVISKDAGNGNLDYLIGRWSSRWRFIARNLNIDISGPVTVVNQWYHVACVFDGTEARLYVDGILENTDVSVGSAVVNNSDVLLGARMGGSPTQFFDGTVDELHIWRRALCEDEIQAQMNCQFDSLHSDSLVLYLSFDQGVADSINTGLDSLIDLSGNNYDGTLNNMALTGASSNWTAGSTGITEACAPYIAPELYVLSEGDTIVNGDSLASVLDSTNLGDLVLFETYSVQYDVFNGGGDTLDIDSVFFTGQDSLMFFALHPNQVAPGDTGTITVQVTPTNNDSILAYLNIASNECNNSPYLFAIEAGVLGYAGALNFDGSDDHVLIPDTIGYDGMSELTVEAWIRSEASTGDIQAILSNTDLSFVHFQVSTGADNITFYHENGVVGLPIVSPAPFGVWKHVAMTVKSGESRVFENGSQVGATSTDVFDSIMVNNTSRIGSGFGSARFFDGDIDEVRVWDRALDSTEIQANMNCELEGTECGLIAYYNFNSDTAVVDGTNTGLLTLGDSSTNSNDGSLVNFALASNSSNWAAQSDSILNNCIDSPDVVGPVVIPFKRFTTYIDEDGVAVIDPNAADSATCDYYSGVDSLWSSPVSVTCANDSDTIYLVVRDSAGNIDSASFVVLVSDTQPPLFIAKSAVIHLNDTGEISISTGSLIDTISDQCIGAALILDSITFDCSNVTLLDTATVDAQNTSQNSSGTGPVGQTFVPINSGLLSEVSLRLSNLGLASTETLEIYHGDPNTGSLIATESFNLPISAGVVEYQISISNPPLVLSGDTYSIKVPTLSTVPVQGYGYQNSNTYADGQIYTGAGVMVPNAARDLYFITEVQQATNIQEVSLTAVDSAGNQAIDTAYVAVIDTTSPISISQPATVYLDSNGQATISPDSINGGSTDNCGIDSIWVSNPIVGCADTTGYTATLVVRDASGNIDSATATVTVIDQISPEFTTLSPVLYIQPNGQTDTLTAADLVASSDDNCAVADTLLSGALSFDCSALSGLDTGTALTFSGNDSVYVAIPHSASLNLTSTITVEAWINTDDASKNQKVVSKSSAGTAANGFVLGLGSGNVTGEFYTPGGFSNGVVSAGGLVSNTWTHIAMTRTTGGQQRIYVNGVLANSNAASAVDLGTDTEELRIGIEPYSLFQYEMDGEIDEVRIWNVERTPAQIANNMNSCLNGNEPGLVAYYRFEDGAGSANVSEYSGNANAGTLTNMDAFTSWVDGPPTLQCAAPQFVSVTVRDVSGNDSTLSVPVTVIDSIRPTVLTQNITVQLDSNGNATIDTGDVNNGSFDNCSIDSLWLSDTSFTCIDSTGDTTWLIARDAQNNIDSAMAIITTDDTIGPVALSQSRTIYLDSNGEAVIAADTMNNGSTDNCSIDSIWLSDTIFFCADTNGVVDTLFVRDVSGNISTSTDTIYVRDTLPPAISVVNDTIFLNTSGIAILDTGDVNAGTTDNCDIDSLWLSNTVFGCNDTIAANAVTFYARDISGNIDSFGITVIVVDTLPPVVMAVNDTVYLDSSGFASIDTSNINNGTSDNCILDSIWVSDTLFSCADSLDNAVTLFARDASSNLDSMTVNVRVLDTLRPQAFVNNVTIYLDSSGMATIAADTIDSASTDNCSVDSIWLSKYDFFCADTIAPDTITFFVRDVSGNKDSSIATVTVLDTQPAVVIPRNLTVYLDNNGGVSFSADTIDSNSSDNCLIDSIWISTDTFSCVDSNANSVTLFVRDISGNLDSAVTTVTVLDTVLPTVITQPRTVYLDSNGSLSISPDTLDAGSFDNCSIDSTWLSADTFACADTNDTVITLYVRDVSGNIDSGTAVLTIEDTLHPIIFTNNIEIYLDDSGSASILPDTVDSATYDNCAIALISISDSSFDCSDTAGVNVITFYATDISGNIDSALVNVTVRDTTPPFIAATGLTLYLDSHGITTVANDSADNGTADNCQLDSVWLEQTVFTCADAGAAFNIYFYAVDIAGNVDSQLISVTVDDTIAPNVTSLEFLTIALDSFGAFNLTPAVIDSGSWDSCGIATYSTDTSNLSCANVGDTFNVVLTVTDIWGNSSTDTTEITVVDSIAPEVITQNINVYLNDSGNVTITAAQVNNGTWDSCSIDSIYIDIDSFTCADVGANTVVLTADDINGNTNSANATVTVIDSIFPMAIAYTDTVIIYLDSFGEATVTVDTIDSVSSDNCNSTITRAISKSFFTCVDAGFSQPIVLTITDASGNISLDTGYIYVDDTIPPVPNTFDSITVFLDSFGMVSIDTSDVLIAISDSCAIADIQIDSTDFTCANTGQTITVTTTITDTTGNVGSDSTVVTVADNILPAPYAHDTVLYLDSNGIIAIDSNALDSASYDVCGIASIVNERDTFYCTDVGAPFPIWMIVTDVNGNKDSVQANVTVFDTIHPVLMLHFDSLLQLDVNGQAIITDSIVDSLAQSYDNCAITARSNVPNIVTCVNVGDTVISYVTMTDTFGNATTDSIRIYSADTVLPDIQLNNITVYLDTFGFLMIEPDTIDSATTDACGIDSTWLDIDSFNCSNIGPNTVQFIAEDIYGNRDTGTAIVTVLDTLAPIVVTMNDTVYLDANGADTNHTDSVIISQWDTCGIASTVLSDTTFDCTQLGVNTETLTVTDVNGNARVLSVDITVLDTITPVIVAVDSVIHLDASGNAVLDTSYVNNGTFDNCSIVTFDLDTTNFDCNSAGDTITVTLTVVDASGNTATDSVSIRVLDTVTPNVIAQNVTVQLNSNGEDTLSWTLVDNGSTDACGIDFIELSDSIFSCSDTGDNIITLSVTDVNGNIGSATAIVTVVDVIAPILVAQDDTIYLDDDGEAFTFVSSIRVSASDECLIDTTFLSDSLFFCGDVGSNSVDITAVDYSGNATTVTVNVEVLDTISPTIVAIDSVIYLDAAGFATLDTSYVNAGSFDNCGIATFTLDTTDFTCANAGDILTVTLNVTDVNGNSDDTTVLVEILDTVAPNALSQNITVQLDTSGNVSIDSSMIDNGSSDACGIKRIVLSDSLFDCGDVGPNIIEMYVTDVNDNSDTVFATVTVEDNIAPFAFAFDSLDVYLDSTGNWTIIVDDIDSASADSCGIDTMFISQYNYDCSDIGAPIIVTLTVEDSNGNVSTDQTVVNVFDTIAPHIVMINDTVYLNASGQATVDSSNFDAGTWDSCGIATLTIDTTNLSCDHTVDSFLVVMTASDVNGNVSVDSSYLFVQDTILPTIVCRGDTTLSNDSGQCGAIFVFDTASAFDNCSIDTIIQTDNSGLVSGSEFPVGTTTIQYTAIDAYGNEDSCSFNITVIDTQAPQIMCPSDTTICDSLYVFSVPNTIDNCPNDTVVQIAGIASGESYPVGTTLNTFVVTDASGLTDTCSFSVTRDDYPSESVAGKDTALCDTIDFILNAIDPLIGMGSWTSLGAATIANDSISTTVVNGLIIGSNEFVWTVTNGVCEAEIDTTSILIDQAPTIALLPASPSLCDEDEVEIIANSPSIGIGAWTASSELNLNDTANDTLLVTGIPLGEHMVYWTITNGVCPPSADSVSIFNNIVPTVDAGDDVARFADKAVTFTPIVTDGATYAWTPADLFEDPTIPDATASAIETTLLTITVTSDSGCIASDSLIYIVNGLDSIPTGITPNGDNINDVWNIPGLSAYPESEVYVFDQAGRRVYFSKGYDTPWDGSFNGQLLPRASYFWIIDLKDGINEPLKGIISIIR